jgi:hypothetical protein
MRYLALLWLACLNGATLMADTILTIDDRRSAGLRSTLGSSWRLVTDRVMGGVSNGELSPVTVEGRPCLRLRGDVSLANSGGFVQAALDVGSTAAADASSYTGIVLEVYGNGQEYNVHLRTADAWLPWQSYRASFRAPRQWLTVQLPFDRFEGYRIEAELDRAHLQRIGLVAIGRAFAADLCVAAISFYRD